VDASKILPLSLHAVTLCYPGRPHPALADVNLVVHPGEHIAITGPSGAGKSSLLALLLRFTEPTSGVISVGSSNLAEIPAHEWRRHLAWVPQHPHLFAASVADNIALGTTGTPDAIRQAARMAGADAFIERLPDGYHTQLGERGLQLSAGQRQRIALARAFLRNAPLLLLDEPTAHLDPFSAGELHSALTELAAGRTVIEVTHNPGLAGPASRVLTLTDGRLTQQITPMGARRQAALRPAIAIAPPALPGPAVTP